MTKVVQNQEMIDRIKFSELAREHHRDLLAYARAITKEDTLSRDIVQDSFVVAWANKDKFDVTRDFPSWMRGIVRNKWRESLRKNKRLVPMEDEMLDSIEGQMREWQAERQDGGPSIFIKLENCLSKLPETVAGAVRSFYYDGSNTEESATELKISGASLRKRLERARSQLKECVSK